MLVTATCIRLGDTSVYKCDQCKCLFMPDDWAEHSNWHLTYIHDVTMS